MTLRIYVAGSSKDIDRCERAITQCREAGMIITEDWVATMRASPPDHLLDEERILAAAIADIRGVESADVVWLLAPPASKPSAGCWAEMDRALTRRIPVVYSPPPVEKPQFCIFTCLIETGTEPRSTQGFICGSDEEAFAILQAMAEGADTRVT